MMPQLLEAAPNAVYVIVTNPCDVLTVLAQEATGLPPERIFASGTVLDTSRLRWLLGRRAGVSTSSVHAQIIGEHGDTEFPHWSRATIGSMPILDWRPVEGEPMTEAELESIAVDVRDAAYTVIRGKGATNYAIGLSSARIVEAILHDEHAIMPVSTVLDDFHGISDVCLSVPAIVHAGGVGDRVEVPMTDAELAGLRASADAVRATARRFGF